MTGRYTLAIDGSTYQGSVALLLESRVVAERTLKEDDGAVPRAGRGERLMPAIADSLREAGVARGEIGRIVCGSGPGSFTSLRVAASVAKGLAAGYGVELFAVSSLLLTVTGTQPPLPSGEYLSVLDAMRGEFHAARIVVPPSLTPLPIDGVRVPSRLSDRAVVGIQTEPSSIISAEKLEELAAAGRPFRIIGPGQQIDAHPHARGVAGLLKPIIETGPVDLASWEPDYGRLAEAQVRWEAAHGRKLST
ncbi:MAG TPA: tRNA (adenosine(37)-N6)-threonylcarbamoyltransferase complex dimerization subunit type 1 TsaB [Gemmatimonadaceae bacterium]|nr:tRNA (adenosine(37)-N6)-threonylcarbamoyltransferase complex dimerization subunit type 1 TsaB [Gemmatimonadaceae bacterium]